MAAGELHAENSTCIFCKKSAVNKKIQCENCSAIFHNSCVKKAKKCCEDMQFQQHVECNLTSNCSQEVNNRDNLQDKSVHNENQILRSLNLELKQSNTLLKEKIAYLEETLTRTGKTSRKEDPTAENFKQSVLEEQFREQLKTITVKIESNFNYLKSKIEMLQSSGIQRTEALQNEQKTSINKVNKESTQTKEQLTKKTRTFQEQDRMTNIQGSSKNNTSNLKLGSEKKSESQQNRENVDKHKVNIKNLEKRQISIMNDIINLEPSLEHNKNNDSKTENAQPNHASDGYQVVHRRNRKINVGKGEADDTFYGRNEKERKIWMFITKVPDAIGDENIKNFISTKTNSDNTNIYVKKLPTQNKSANNQSFMVGVVPDLKNTVYDPMFWPRKVVFDRFDFKRGRKFLDKQANTAALNDDDRPSSFL